MKKTLILSLLISVIYFNVSAQDSNFKPSGKPFVTIFSNFHVNDLGGELAPAFELNRAYLGYSYYLSKNFSAKLNIDVGNPGIGKLQHTTFIKIAALTYKTEKISVDFGMISTNLFKVQEKNWDHRYMYKTFLDGYKLGHSADLGVSVRYKPVSFITIDAIIINGEGYKNVQADSTFKAGIGFTVEPVKKLQLRAYVETMPENVSQNTFTAFIGYVGDKFSFGGEYNKQWNHDMITDQNYGGISAYASYFLNDKFELFGRYDNLSSDEISGNSDPWNIANDGELFILGLEYAAIKGVKISPNFQAWNPASDGSSIMYNAFLSLEVKF
ncbi:porin [Bacteroidota bacterium]